MLDTTFDSVKSGPQTGTRQPAAPTARQPPITNRLPPPIRPLRVRWWRSSSARTSPRHLTPLVALLTDDVFVSMPPLLSNTSRDIVARFCRQHVRRGPQVRPLPTRANGQPAFGAYLYAATATATDRASSS